KRTLKQGIEELRTFNPALIVVIKPGKTEAATYGLNRDAQIDWPTRGNLVPEEGESTRGKIAPSTRGKIAPSTRGKIAPSTRGKIAPISKINIETNIETRETTLLAAPRAEKKKTPKTSPKEKPPSNPNHHHPMVDLYREISGCNGLTK